jgi:CheY-specific phosphatase CheX
MSDIKTLDLIGFVTHSVKSVFQTMLSMEVQLDHPLGKERICTNGHIVGTVGFAGRAMGTINLFVSRTFAREMAAAMLGMAVEGSAAMKR